MGQGGKILLQTTIPYAADNWHTGRFSLLTEHLRSLEDAGGTRRFDVTARDREPDSSGADPLLGSIDESDFDQLWLFALDLGDGLTPDECEAITQFRRRGGAIVSARDHNDMGSSLCTLGGIGASHYFHSKNPDPDPSRNARDDQDTPEISYPNYHSGSNGDFQIVKAADHPLFRRPDGTLIEFFPAHPHEGGIGAPSDDPSASVVATGTSEVTGRDFNLVVAFDGSDGSGRAIAESSFHHLVDYNWDTDLGSPSFVTEPPGDGCKRDRDKLGDIKQYVENAAVWLSGRNGGQ